MKPFSGKVLKTSDKTIAVEVSRKWVHPIYQKTVTRTKKYLVHDPQNQAAVGQTVSFQVSRPHSKKKHFELVKITGSKAKTNK